MLVPNLEDIISAAIFVILPIFFVIILVIKLILHLVLKRLNKQPYKINIIVACLPLALYILLYLFSHRTFGYYVDPTVLIILPIIVVTSFVLLSLADFIYRLKRPWNIIAVLLIIAVYFFFKPKEMLIRTYGSVNDTYRVCQCAGIHLPDGKRCFGVVYSCTMTSTPPSNYPFMDDCDRELGRPCIMIEDKGKLKVTKRSEVLALYKKYGRKQVLIDAVDIDKVKDKDFIAQMGLDSVGGIGCIIVVRAGSEGYVYLEDVNELNIIHSETLLQFQDRTRQVNPAIIKSFYSSLH